LQRAGLIWCEWELISGWEDLIWRLLFGFVVGWMWWKSFIEQERSQERMGKMGGVAVRVKIGGLIGSYSITGKYVPNYTSHI